MNNKSTVFIFFHSRFRDLETILRGNDSGKMIMGEIMWFYSFMRHLTDNRNIVLHCKEEADFLQAYVNHKQCGNRVKLIMDYITIPMTIRHLYHDIDNVYCMCYWGRDLNGVSQLGSVNNKHIPITNILTPFQYFKQNTYLGYDMSYICRKLCQGDSDTAITRTPTFEKIGILWGKDINLIQTHLVKYLTGRGMKFYSVTNIPLGIYGVTDLGVLSVSSWQQLLNDGKYILSFGHPSSGPTILEALFYKTRLFGPRQQYPESVHNKNILFTDNLEYSDIYELIIQNQDFIEEDEVCKSLVKSESFRDRIETIFGV